MSDRPGKELSLFDNDEQSMSIVDEALNVPGYDPNLHFEPSEARKALRKVDFLILPPIVLCFCFLQFDRTNIGNALTNSLRQDIAVGNTQVNLAQTLFTVGFIVSELPFNIVSKRIGPERFLPITMCLWGIVTWSQVFIKNATGLYACRFLIGTLEGGYIPGFALYISKFYANNELALRYAIFWAANSFAGALSGPLSIGLLSLRGRGGLKGWQWLFLVAKPKTIFGKSFSLFKQREASIIVTRVIANDPSKALQYGKPVLPSHIWDTFSDWRLYGHLVAALLSMVMIAPMNTYAPSIIKSMGFSSLQANGLNSVGSICALVWSVSLAFSSDRFQERGFHVAAGYLFGVVGLLWLALASETVGKWVLYGGVVWTQMGMGSAQAISAAWLTTKMEDHKRPVALAAYVMCIQLANFPGNQLFRTQDAPRYRHGLLVAAFCAIAATVVILVWKLLYRLFDAGDCGVGAKRTKDQGTSELDSDSSETHFGKRNSSPKYSATKSSTDLRLEQLERTVGALLERLDASSQNQARSEEKRKSERIIQPENEERPAELDPAPVILIRKAATDAGVSPPGQFDLSNNLTDVISAGLITAPAAYSLLELPAAFSRSKEAGIERFAGGFTVNAAFSGYTNSESVVDNDWSATSKYGWLVADWVRNSTGFCELSVPRLVQTDFRGTRMVAEVRLYWVMYTKCSAQDCRVDLQAAKVGLKDWKNEHANLLDEPRSQFLQMSFSFAHLLAYCQATQSLQSSLDTSLILEMIELSRDIINLAMDTTDDRTRHLTDHIYHLIVFSALTLCRLVHTYEDQLRATNVDPDSIDEILIKLIDWLRNVGLPCHVAHLLGDVVEFQFQKLRPNHLPDTTANPPQYTQDLPNIEFYPDFIGHELFSMDDDMTGWS
ncbi:putative transporter [Beauveria bassiana D1-5]|uniref:Putative transporter n=1 Tax=Beauveria bassiana D1-5 TaxID=1245745 RepID=A0A0A2VUC2_BEABA|nr:putative transporter [Beauveria bassiana D1-5]